MIDFRYHLVSIVAVFLALAIGIVLGSTELQGPVYRALDKTTSVLQGRLDNANSQLSAADQAVGADNAWLQANEPVVLHGLLAGQKMLIVTEPGAQASVISGLTTAATDAGATVIGRIDLTSKFFDASSSTTANLAALNASLAQQTGIQLDSGLSDQQQAAARILAGALIDGSGTVGGQANGDTQAASADTTLQAYNQAGYLTVAGSVTATRATTVVVITPQTAPSDGGSDQLAQALGPIAEEMAKSAAVVVAGSAGGSGDLSPIAVLRGAPAAGLVSTVDDADTTIGQMAVIQALHIQLTGGKPGAYGRDAGGGPQYPSLTPATTPASPSASPSSSKKPKK